MADTSLHNPEMFSAPPGKGGKPTATRSQTVFRSTFPGVAQTKYVPPAAPSAAAVARKAILDRAAAGKISAVQAQDQLRAAGVVPAGKSPGRTQVDMTGHGPTSFATKAAMAPFEFMTRAAQVAGYVNPAVAALESPYLIPQIIGQVQRSRTEAKKGNYFPAANIAALSSGPLAPFRKGIPAEGALGPEEAAKAVAAAAQGAKTEGFGSRAIKREPPAVLKGQTTPETGGELGAQVRKGLQGGPTPGVQGAVKGAKGVRNEQELGYSAERAKRAGAAETAMEQGGVAGYHAALGKLKGELPKLNFKNFQDFSPEAVDSLLTHIQQHPELRTYEKINAQGAILKAIGGIVPTKSEQRLLEVAFGRDVRQQIVDSIPFWKKAKNLALETLNVPRAIMSSFDLSAPFRQGLVVGVTRPGMFFKNFGPMVKAFGSENTYQALMADVHERQTFPLMQKAGLALTDIGAEHAGAALSQREEQFMSNLAEHLHEIPGIRRTPAKYPLAVVSHGVRASDRAYTGFLNKTRADYFDFLVHSAAMQGRDVNDEKLLQSIARFVNSATGRGDLGALKSHAVTLNTLLFSPRLLFSRLNFLNPIYYVKLDPFARREALRAALGLVSTISAVLYLAKLGGAKVSTDPRNADFAKIRIGNTRIDIAGGFQQPIRVLGQVAMGSRVNSSNGQVTSAKPGFSGWANFAGSTLTHFFEGKLSPVPSIINDYRRGHDFSYQTPTLKREAAQHMIPLLWQDVSDLRKQGVLPAAAGLTVGTFGIGLQTYADQSSGLAGPSSPPAHSDHMFGAPPARGKQSPIVHSSGMFSAPPKR